MSKNIKKLIQYIDDDSGELLEYREYTLYKEYLIPVREGSRYIKGFTSRASIPKCIRGKWKWVGYWLYLQRQHMEMHTNLLVEFERDGNSWTLIPMNTQKDIARVLEVSMPTIERFLSVCQDNLLIKKGELGYYLNPYYGYNGAGVHPETCYLFLDSPELWNVLTTKQKALIGCYLAKNGEITSDDIRIIREKSANYQLSP